MKRFFLSSLLVTASVAVVACDRPKDDTSAIELRLQELEEGKVEDQKRQRALEQELADQKIAMEWEAIERERLQIEDARAALAAKEKEGSVLTGALDALQERDELLAARENKVEGLQAELMQERRAISDQKLALSEADLALAGRQAGALPPQREIQSATVDYQFFHNSLSSYGSWYESDEYGSVWQPAACSDPSWRPYTRGQWVCSDRGWTWVSSEPFGWATYHYGRWALIRNRGWIWVPGTEWAPSWCSWRTGDNFIGWAPLPPETLAYQNRGWDSHVETQYGIDPACYTFVEPRHFDRQLSNFCVPLKENFICVRLTQNVTNIQIVNRQVFCGGPGYRELSKRVGRPIPYYQIERSRDSYDRPNNAHLRTRLEGDRLIVAAPTVVRGEERLAVPMKTRGRIMTTEVERSETADPEAIAAYQRERAREERLPRIPDAAEPAGTPPVAQVPSGRERPRPQDPVIPPVMPEQPAVQPEDDRITGRERPNGGRTPDAVKPVETPPVAQVPTGRDRPRPEAPVPPVMPEQPAVQPEDGRVAETERPTVERPKIAPNAKRPGGRPSRVPDDAGQAAQEQARRDEAMNQAEQARQAQQRQREEAMNAQAEAERNQRAEAQARLREEALQKQQEDARRQQEEGMKQEEGNRKQRGEQQAREQAREREEAQREQQEAMRRQREEEAQRQQQEEMQRQREEAQRRQQEEAQRQQQEEMQRQREEEAQRRQQEEAQRQQQEEMQRQREEEAQRRQQEEEQRRQQEEAQRQQQEEMQRQQEEAQRQQQEEMQRQQQEEAQRQQQEEAQRQQQEQQQQQQ